jgi:thymidine kinase
MFARKSSSMCDAVERYNIAQKVCVIVRYDKDGRYDELATSGGLVVHSKREYCGVPFIRTKNLADIEEELMLHEVIGVDEVQFFLDCVEVLQRLANAGKIIIASGLDGNYLAKPFGRIHELIPLCEDVIKLKAVCMRCCADASFTQRLSDNDNEVLIGGKSEYIAVCRKCRFSH